MKNEAEKNEKTQNISPPNRIVGLEPPTLLRETILHTIEITSS